MYTMNRCFALAVTTALAALMALPVTAQLSEPLPVTEQPNVSGVRKFPAKALRGRLKVIQGRDILIDGKPDQLSPGSRIRDPQNRLVMSGALIDNREYIVNFTRESYGMVHEVWLLNAEEAKQKLATNTPERNFNFASDDAKKLDDGKTPFNQLPTYKELGSQQRQQQQR
jgi:hypothetical protein